MRNMSESTFQAQPEAQRLAQLRPTSPEAGHNATCKLIPITVQRSGRDSALAASAAHTRVLLTHQRALPSLHLPTAFIAQ